MLNLCMYLDGVQILWKLLSSSDMSGYSITAQDSSQRCGGMCVVDGFGWLWGVGGCGVCVVGGVWVVTGV